MRGDGFPGLVIEYRSLHELRLIHLRVYKPYAPLTPQPNMIPLQIQKGWKIVVTLRNSYINEIRELDYRHLETRHRAIHQVNALFNDSRTL